MDSGPSESCLMMAEVPSQVLRKKNFPEQGLRLLSPSRVALSLYPPFLITELLSEEWWKHMSCPPGQLGNTPHHIVTKTVGQGSEQWCANRFTSGPLFQAVVSHMSVCSQVLASYQQGQQQTLKLHSCGCRQSFPNLGSQSEQNLCWDIKKALCCWECSSREI